MKTIIAKINKPYLPEWEEILAIVSSLNSNSNNKFQEVILITRRINLIRRNSNRLNNNNRFNNNRSNRLLNGIIKNNKLKEIYHQENNPRSNNNNNNKITNSRTRIRKMSMTRLLLKRLAKLKHLLKNMEMQEIY